MSFAFLVHLQIFALICFFVINIITALDALSFLLLLTLALNFGVRKQLTSSYACLPAVTVYRLEEKTLSLSCQCCCCRSSLPKLTNYNKHTQTERYKQIRTQKPDWPDELHAHANINRKRTLSFVCVSMLGIVCMECCVEKSE